jgi:hypothetical protein
MRSAAHARRLRQVLRRATGLTIPMLLLGGLLLPAAAPAAQAATCGPTNLALNQPATASSTENASFPRSSGPSRHPVRSPERPASPKGPLP